MNQDVTPQQAKSCNEFVEHEYALRKYGKKKKKKKKKKKNTTKKQGRILAAIIAHLQNASRP